MRKHLFLLCCLFPMTAPLTVLANNSAEQYHSAQSVRLTEADRKMTAGRILLKWGGYVEKVKGQNKKAWAARLWPVLAGADLYNLQKATTALTYEGMYNALVGQRANDDEIIDRYARASLKAGSVPPKSLGSNGEDLVYTPIVPCRIADTRSPFAVAPYKGKVSPGKRALRVSSPGGNLQGQRDENRDCGVPSGVAAVALSVTALDNSSTGFLRVFPADGDQTQGSPVPTDRVNATVTNDIVVQTNPSSINGELEVSSTQARTNFAVFVNGYFMAPKATAPECTTMLGNLTLPTPFDGAREVTDKCPANFGMTSVYCFNGNNQNVLLGGSGIVTDPTGDKPFCQCHNKSGAIHTVTQGVRCCRIPGR